MPFLERSAFRQIDRRGNCEITMRGEDESSHFSEIPSGKLINITFSEAGFEQIPYIDQSSKPDPRLH